MSSGKVRLKNTEDSESSPSQLLQQVKRKIGRVFGRKTKGKEEKKDVNESFKVLQIQVPASLERQRQERRNQETNSGTMSALEFAMCVGIDIIPEEDEAMTAVPSTSSPTVTATTARSTSGNYPKLSMDLYLPPTSPILTGSNQSSLFEQYERLRKLSISSSSPLSSPVPYTPSNGIVGARSNSVCGYRHILRDQDINQHPNLYEESHEVLDSHLTSLSLSRADKRKSPVIQVTNKGRFQVIKEKTAHSSPGLSRYSQMNNGESRFKVESPNPLGVATGAFRSSSPLRKTSTSSGETLVSYRVPV